MSENVLPIYGIWSRSFDAVAVGVRSISGMFVVNFVRPGYLLEVLQSESLGPVATPSEGWTESVPRFRQEYIDNNLVSLSPAEDSDVSAETLGALAIQDLDKFLEMADSLDEQYYQTGRKQAQLDFQVGDRVKSLFYNEHGYIKPTSLSVIYKPSRPNEGGALSASARVIEGVHIVACRQLLDMSGRTVMEEYQFIARDVRIAEEGNSNTEEIVPAPDDEAPIIPEGGGNS